MSFFKVINFIISIITIGTAIITQLALVVISNFMVTVNFNYINYFESFNWSIAFKIIDLTNFKVIVPINFNCNYINYFESFDWSIAFKIIDLTNLVIFPRNYYYFDFNLLNYSLYFEFIRLFIVSVIDNN